MNYYLVIPNESPILLGEQSFGFFYADQGFDILTNLMDKKPKLIEFIKIVTEQNVTYTVEEFLDLFEEGGLQMRRQT